jgi:xanthine dehydrogenase YagR molybdenum-binding subunit
MPDTTQRIPTHMPTDNRPANMGVSFDDDTSRLEGVAKVTGAARYSRDTYLPNALFLAFIRCPYGAATLRAHDTKDARAVPGFVEVEFFETEGKYNGQPVGYIVADTETAMRRAIRALKLNWRMSTADTSINDVILDAPEISGDVRLALQDARHTLSAVYSTQVQTHAPAETHGGVVDHKGDAAILYCSTQGTFAARDGMDDAFGIPVSKIEVRCEHVGGGFGSKLRAGKESLYAGKVAAKHKRPVYCFVDRAEEHLDTGNRPSSRTHVDIAFDDQGNIIAGRIQSYGGVGVSGNGRVTFPSQRYNLGDLDRDHESVRFNAGAERPFRAPGGPQGAFAEELMLDEIATAVGVDPLELRLRLAAHEDLPPMFRIGAERIGWADRKPTGSQKSTIRRGFGIGAASWPRFPARTEAEVVINADGSVESRTGTQDIGTGQRTVMGVCVARQLGIPLDLVDVRIGNSNYPIGPASGGSMTVHNTAPVMMLAADNAKDELLLRIADRTKSTPDQLTIVNGEILKDGTPLMSWKDACRTLGTRTITGRADRAAGVARYGGEGNSFGAQFVDLSVDTETGQIRVDRVVAVQECGQVIVRKTAENQVIGGVIQGISYALYEDRILDRNTGTMVNPNLEMYKWAGARDVPLIEPIFYTKGQTGPRSLGEPPTIPTAGAVACAVYNAIGVPVRSLPLTPDKVLAAMKGGAS